MSGEIECRTGPKWGTMEWERLHPLGFKPEDMTNPPDVLLEKVRRDLSHLRLQISDIKRGYGWTDNLDTAEAGLTLVISYLYYTIQEIEKVRKEENENGVG